MTPGRLVRMLRMGLGRSESAPPTQDATSKMLPRSPWRCRASGRARGSEQDTAEEKRTHREAAEKAVGRRAADRDLGGCRGRSISFPSSR